MARALVVYYSLSGTTKQVADILVTELQKIRIETIVEVIKCTQAEGAGMAKQGFRTVFGTKYVLDNPPQNDPREFEYVLIGSPIWSLGNTPVLDEWMKLVKFDTTKTKFGAFIQCFGTFYNKIFNKIEKVVGKPLTAKVPIFQKEAKNSPEIITKKIEDFVNGMFPIENSANAAATETYAEGSPQNDEVKEESKTE
ncbi:MAG: hypothetical protein EZS28_010795 [Streblomastix strix]|uniref:Flavodoxin-like domain-containing protein n=1 Tax=Streblomastix strix TaxID=222440 RepID=A0A5J4WHB1_9EUKA|nr:MAG: hypothetical protein EZS28_010795 [Streblomastix strix]